MYEEGWETEYVVIERVPPAPAPEEKEDEHDGWPNFAALAGGPWTQPDPDYREPALRIDIESINVHVVRRVEFKTTEYHVRRYRWEKREISSDF
jgi:hypothetical protein